MSIKQIYEDGRCRTNLFYREGLGLSIERIDRKTNQKHKFTILPEELNGLVTAWPELQEFLLSAGVPNVGQAMRSPTTSKESPERGNSPSSPHERTLL